MTDTRDAKKIQQNASTAFYLAQVRAGFTKTMETFHLHLYGPDRGPLPTSFEQAFERLGQLPMIYLEGDGSFVWTQPGGREQIFGMLYDAADRLQYVELRGQCSVAIWQQLIGALRGESNHDLAVFRLPQRQWQDLQTFEETSLR